MNDEEQDDLDILIAVHILAQGAGTAAENYTAVMLSIARYSTVFFLERSTYHCYCSSFHPAEVTIGVVVFRAVVSANASLALPFLTKKISPLSSATAS